MVGIAASKVDIYSIAEKNRIAKRIYEALAERDGFLLLGHRNPDEDCVASMVAFALLASKLHKNVYLYFGGKVPVQFSYLLSICHYNSIELLSEDTPLPSGIRVLVALDTPKPEMLDIGIEARELLARPDLLKIEIDHHIGSDAAYIGDEGYRLVAVASSACELVGYMAMKMDADPRYGRRGDDQSRLLARNFVLAVLTGIIADSRMGKYLRTNRERLFYERFSSLFDSMLSQKTNAGSGNFASKEEVFAAIASLSGAEEDCYRRMMGGRGRLEHVEYVILDETELAALHDDFGEEILISIAKAAADALAEEGGELGLVAYPDHPSASDLAQFRVRRSHSYRGLDLRESLPALSATNGGGHPGAVGFRFPKSEIGDFRAFAMGIARKLDELADSASAAGG
jgi:Exopolyphosphatase-related proteins